MGAYGLGILFHTWNIKDVLYSEITVLDRT